MHIASDENIIATVKRHPTPYIIALIEALVAVIPIFGVAYLVTREISRTVMVTTLGVLFFIALVGFLIATLDYILDKLIITNKRVIWIDWKSLLKKQENELQLSDIQNVKTSELGVLSNLALFRYGRFEVESAASQTSIIFRQCNDPKTTKHIMLTAVEKMKAERKNRLLTNQANGIIDA